MVFPEETNLMSVDKLNQEEIYVFFEDYTQILTKEFSQCWKFRGRKQVGRALGF